MTEDFERGSRPPDLATVHDERLEEQMPFERHLPERRRE